MCLPAAKGGLKATHLLPPARAVTLNLRTLRTRSSAHHHQHKPTACAPLVPLRPLGRFCSNSASQTAPALETPWPGLSRTRTLTIPHTSWPHRVIQCGVSYGGSAPPTPFTHPRTQEVGTDETRLDGRCIQLVRAPASPPVAQRGTHAISLIFSQVHHLA